MSDEDSVRIYDMDRLAVNDLYRCATILQDNTIPYENITLVHVAANVLESILHAWAFKDDSQMEELFLTIDEIDDPLSRQLVKKVLDDLVQCRAKIYPMLNQSKLAIIEEFHAEDCAQEERFFYMAQIPENKSHFMVSLN